MHAHIRLCTDTQIHRNSVQACLWDARVFVCVLAGRPTVSEHLCARLNAEKKRKKNPARFSRWTRQRRQIRNEQLPCHGQLRMWAGLSSRQSHGSWCRDFCRRVISDPAKFVFYSLLTTFSVLLRQQITRQGDRFQRSCDPVIPFWATRSHRFG